MSSKKQEALLFMGASSELLPGEIAVARASNAQQVLYYIEGSDHQPKHYVSGTLMCTNYRVSFVPDTELATRVLHIDEDSLSSSRDIPLATIHQINMLSGGGKHRKVLDGRSTLPRKITEFEILCKDLRRVIFSVKQCSKHDASSVVNAVARHSHPSSVSLLFAFDHTHAVRAMKEDTPTGQDTPTPTFLNPRDWQRELDRLGVTNDQWRVSEANKQFLICDSLSPYFACPTAIADSALETVASVHLNRRLPIWCWSHPHTGVSLTRGGAVEIDDQSEAPNSEYMRSVANARHSEADDRRVKQCSVNKYCGSVREVHDSYARMQELCMPTSSVDLSVLDKKWLTALEASGWLVIVRACLSLANSVANHLCSKQKSIMLLEDTGHDLSSVVSSLVQLMVDPHFRSISGFEALVQKEWVATGHPFTTRHALVIGSIAQLGPEEQVKEAPVFLLFLDCVWQLSKQFPSAFEFSESFLLHLHDMTHNSLYGNFIFDSAKKRLQAAMGSYRRSSGFEDFENFLLSAWNRWRDSLTKEESEQCLNPLYYVFGCGDAHYDCGTVTLQKDRLSVLSDTTIDLTAAGNYGLYSKRSSSSDTFLSFQEEDVKPGYHHHHHQGLILPETSMCSIKVWSGYFFRYIAELHQHEQPRKIVQQMESRLVKDVRKLKDELNEIELTLGSYTSDLTSFIGEVLESRDKEIQQNRKSSVDASIPFRPRLSAFVYSYEDGSHRFSSPTPTTPEIEGDVVKEIVIAQNGDVSHNSNGKPPLPPHRFKSLAQFTDDLYRSEQENASRLRPKQLLEQRSLSTPCTGSVSPTARSPVTKTRLRVVKGKASDPVLAPWQRTPSPRSEKKIARLSGKIIVRKDSWDSLDEGQTSSQEHEITEL